MAFFRFLAKSGVKEEIINFDAHRISSEVHKKVSSLVKAKAASFDPKVSRYFSIFSFHRFSWFHADIV